MDVALIPAYDNGSAIGGVVAEAARHVDAVLVCDDGSSDQTAARAEERGATVLRHGKNRGKGAALRTLFEKARQMGADRACTIDGDGQFDPSEIPRLLGAQENSGADVVVGYRFDDRTEMPRYRRLGNRFFDKMTNMAVDVSVRDTQSGFRVYSKRALEQVTFKSDGFAADSEIIIDAARRGLSMSEQKITVTYGGGGHTLAEPRVPRVRHIQHAAGARGHTAPAETARHTRAGIVRAGHRVLGRSHIDIQRHRVLFGAIHAGRARGPGVRPDTAVHVSGPVRHPDLGAPVTGARRPGAGKQNPRP